MSQTGIHCLLALSRSGALYLQNESTLGAVLGNDVSSLVDGMRLEIYSLIFEPTLASFSNLPFIIRMLPSNASFHCVKMDRHTPLIANRKPVLH